MSFTVYDFAIIGAGAAGLHLALAMSKDDWFKEKKVLILEKDDKNTNDRTWSFWEKGQGQWDEIITKSWSKGSFITSSSNVELDLLPYRYKTLHAIEFYNYGKSKIDETSNIHWQKDEIESVETRETIYIKGKHSHYQAKQVFDSRIDDNFWKAKDNYYRVLQHFKGWIIETPKPTFDPESFVMMDYRIKWKDSTSFTYVLPTSPTRALIEFTFFNLELIDKDEYDDYLKKYIKEILKIKDYSIKEVEYGIIPMSNYPFHESNKPGITKIGTAASWVKPSSGYAFKNIEKMVGKVIKNLKKNQPPSHGLLSKKFRFYDTLFLDVLSQKNELGESLFETMYSKNSIQQIFKFLDEETSFLEEMKIMNTFNPLPFLKALLYHSSGIRIQ
jgi:lycopene beta-cyclase